MKFLIDTKTLNSRDFADLRKRLNIEPGEFKIQRK